MKKLKKFKEWLSQKNTGVIPQPIHFKHVHKKHKKKKVVKEEHSNDHPDVEKWKGINNNFHISNMNDVSHTLWDINNNIRNELTKNLKLNHDHRNALSHYTGTGAEDINGKLLHNHLVSTGNYPDEKPKELSLKEHVTTDHLDSAIKNNPASHDYHVYSGLGFNPLAHMNENNTLFSPSYISATTSKYMAHYYAHKNSEHPVYDKHMMHIHVKKGDPVLAVHQSTSQYPSEFETIVGRGTKLKYLKTETINDRTVHNNRYWDTPIHIHHFEIER